MRRILALLMVLSLIYGLATASQRAEKAPVAPWIEQELTQLSPLPLAESFPIVERDITTTTNPEDLMLWATISQRLLADTSSDSHNEPLHLYLLEAVAACETLTGTDSTRLEFMLDMARRNAVGTRANDLSFVTQEGDNGQLYDVTTPLTLVYFNDPDCDACMKVKERLDTCDALRRLVATRQLTVLAVYPYGDEDLWQSTTYPDYVVNARESKGDIEDNETYCWTTLPVFYLLDKEKTVLMKNEPSLNRTLSSIAEITSAETKYQRHNHSNNN